MIVKFSVSNFMNINKATYDFEDDNLCFIEDNKESFIEAIRFLKNAITIGFGKIKKDNLAKPTLTTFEIELVLAGEFYTYGISVSLNKGNVIKEYMYKGSKKIFEINGYYISNNINILGIDEAKIEFIKNSITKKELFVHQSSKVSWKGNYPFVLLVDWFENLVISDDVPTDYIYQLKYADINNIVFPKGIKGITFKSYYNCDVVERDKSDIRYIIIKTNETILRIKHIGEFSIVEEMLFIMTKGEGRKTYKELSDDMKYKIDSIMMCINSTSTFGTIVLGKIREDALDIVKKNMFAYSVLIAKKNKFDKLMNVCYN